MDRLVFSPETKEFSLWTAANDPHTQLAFTLKNSRIHFANTATTLLNQAQLDCLWVQTTEADCLHHHYFNQTESDRTLFTFLAESLGIPYCMQQHVPTLQEIENAYTRQCWQLQTAGVLPAKKEYAIESLLTTGNGYLGLRGTRADMTISADHYPATYLAGIYNVATSLVGTETVTNEDFVNTQNAQQIRIALAGQNFQTFNATQIQQVERQLDFKTGLLSCTMIVELAPQRHLEIEFERIVSMADRHFYGQQVRLKALDFNESVAVEFMIDGSVQNFNVERYRTLTAHHLDVLASTSTANTLQMTTQTKNSQVQIQQTLHHQLPENFQVSETTVEEKRIRRSFEVPLQAGEVVEFATVVHVTENLHSEELISPTTWPQYTSLKKASFQAWAQLWKRHAVTIKGDLRAQKCLNLHTYHMLVSASPNGNQNLDASVTARGLHGEAYRGHIFWDELFILPFYFLHAPETAKELLRYRYHRLAAAKANAQEEGYRGAMYPWQSGMDGSEQSQKLHLNPLSGKWDEDHSRLQRHVSLAIAYNVWSYVQVTGDQAFWSEAGYEMLLEIALFWQSKAEKNPATGRYDIAGVMGPDEFHEAYPGAQQGGLTNNAYTTIMVSWLFGEITKLHAHPQPSFSQIELTCELTSEDWQKFAEIQNHLALEQTDQGLLAQYAGYFDLKEIDWSAMREKYGNVYRMDRILKAQGQSPDDFQVAKQADVLMAFYNFSESAVRERLLTLGYGAPTDLLATNFEYYLARTSHGSTLSRIVHAKLAGDLGQTDLAWRLYQEALGSDYEDIQGGTTAEGIHTGVMAATLTVTLQLYAGIDYLQETLSCSPRLPEHWQELSFTVVYQGSVLDFTITHQLVEVTSSLNCDVILWNQSVSLKAQQTKRIEKECVV